MDKILVCGHICFIIKKDYTVEAFFSAEQSGIRWNCVGVGKGNSFLEALKDLDDKFMKRKQIWSKKRKGRLRNENIQDWLFLKKD